MAVKGFCQSCGMPIKKDPKQGGTNADGGKSKEYCSYCYDKGKFHDSFTNVKDMQKFCIKKMKEQGMSGIVAWLFTRNMPRLKRWKK